MLTFTLPQLKPSRAFSQFQGTDRCIPSVLELLPEILTKAGNPLNPDFRDRLADAVVARFAAETDALLPAWLKVWPKLTPEQAVRLAARLTIRNAPKYAALFLLSIEKNAPELSEAYTKEAVGVLEESPDALLLLLLSPTIEKPSPNELKFPTEIRSLLMIRRSVIGGQWHIMTMLRLMSENRYKASDTAAQALLANPGLKSLTADLTLRTEMRHVVSRLLFADSKGFQPSSAILKLLDQAVLQCRQSDREAMRVLVFFTKEIKHFGSLHRAVCSCDYAGIDKHASELSRCMKDAGIEPTDLEDIGLTYGTELTAGAGISANPAETNEQGLPLSETTANFLQNLGMPPKIISVWQRPPEEMVGSVIQAVCSGGSAPVTLSLLPAERWRRGVCRHLGVSTDIPWRRLPIEPVYAFLGIIPGKPENTARETVLAAGAKNTLKNASSYPNAAAWAYRQALALPKTREEALSLMGTSEWFAAGGCELHRQYNVRRKDRGQSWSDFIDDIVEAFDRARTPEGRGAKARYMLAALPCAYNARRLQPFLYCLNRAVFKGLLTKEEVQSALDSCKI